jgi:hypothetical protein
MSRGRFIGAGVAIALAMSAGAALPGTASAAAIEFTITADAADWPWIGRSFVPGDVTGILYGLDDNGTNQIPTSFTITSDTSALGVVGTTLSPLYHDGGFDMVDGVVVGASILLNFVDDAGHFLQLRFNYSDRDVLHWNGGDNPSVGYGKADGVSGARFVGRTAEVLEPAALALLVVGVAGLGLSRRRVN